MLVFVCIKERRGRRGGGDDYLGYGVDSQWTK